MISGLVDSQVFNMKTCLEALKVNKSLWVLFISLTFSCTKTPANPANLTVENDVKDIPYVLLISIDGYRWDYTDKYSPPFISTFKNKGVSLKSLRPSFPTKTFPNHLSIVTGRYPMNHGIVGNKFYNPELKSFYSIRDSEAVANNEFYHSLPIWGLAEKQGLKTAPYFDNVNFARHIQIPMIMSIGFVDGTCKPTTVYAAYNAFQGPKQILDRPRMGHEGGFDIQQAFLSFLFNQKKSE